MDWKIEFDSKVLKDLAKLDKQAAKQIIYYLEEQIKTSDDPRKYGKPLKGSLKGLWRYRIADYRIICQIKDKEMLILVAKVGHRKKIYK